MCSCFFFVQLPHTRSFGLDNAYFIWRSTMTHTHPPHQASSCVLYFPKFLPLNKGGFISQRTDLLLHPATQWWCYFSILVLKYDNVPHFQLSVFTLFSIYSCDLTCLFSYCQHLKQLCTRTQIQTWKEIINKQISCSCFFRPLSSIITPQIKPNPTLVYAFQSWWFKQLSALIAITWVASNWSKPSLNIL